MATEVPVFISKYVGKTDLAAGSFYERPHCRSSTLFHLNYPRLRRGKMEEGISWNLPVIMES